MLLQPFLLRLPRRLLQQQLQQQQRPRLLNVRGQDPGFSCAADVAVAANAAGNRRGSRYAGGTEGIDKEATLSYKSRSPTPVKLPAQDLQLLLQLLLLPRLPFSARYPALPLGL